MEEWLGLAPEGGEHAANLGTNFRPVGGEETPLGHDGGQHVVPHLVGVLTAHHLAEDVESLPRIGQALGSDHRPQ